MMNRLSYNAFLQKQKTIPFKGWSFLVAEMQIHFCLQILPIYSKSGLYHKIRIYIAVI